MRTPPRVPVPAGRALPVAVGLLATLALGLVVAGNDPVARGVAAACVLWLLAAGGDRIRRLVGGVVGIVTVATLGALLLDLATQRMARPPFFDFLALWLPARATIDGSLYDAGPSLELARALGAPPEFLDQLGAGPSPTELLLLLPFGALPEGAAAVWWMLLLLAGLTTAIVVLWRRHQPATPRGLLAVTAFVLLLPATAAIVSLAAPTFLILAAVAVWATHRGARLAGAALALTLLVRPTMALLLLVPTPGARRELVGFLVVSAAIGALVLGILGPAVLGGYLATEPFDPSRILDTQQVNQSLSGWTARLSRSLPPDVRPLLWIGWVAVLAATAHTLLARRLSGRGSDRLRAAFAISAMLLLDPGTLQHTLVLLAIAWLLAWDERARLRIGAGALAALIGAGVALSGMDGAVPAVLAPLGTWLALLAAIRIRGDVPAAADDDVGARVAEPSGA